jgi:metal-sulfur cluster biosynthetic enzyme
MEARPTERDVYDALSDIIDPCSITAGAPASLQQMGLIRQVTCTGSHVHVELGLTEPMCIMGGYFIQEARARLRSIPGVESIEVTMDGALHWTERDLDPTYAQHLAEVRAARAQPIRISAGPIKRQDQTS